MVARFVFLCALIFCAACQLEKNGWEDRNHEVGQESGGLPSRVFAPITKEAAATQYFLTAEYLFYQKIYGRAESLYQRAYDLQANAVTAEKLILSQTLQRKNQLASANLKKMLILNVSGMNSWKDWLAELIRQLVVLSFPGFWKIQTNMVVVILNLFGNNRRQNVH